MEPSATRSHPLDGTPAEFPNRSEAMTLYRVYWSAWLAAPESTSRKALEAAMDEEQVRIAHGPGPLWRAYCNTLPGYAEVWEGITSTLVEAGVRTLTR